MYGETHLTQRFYLPWEDIEIGVDYSYTSNHRWMYTKNHYNHSLAVNLFYPISKSFKLGISFNDIFNTSRSKSEYDFKYDENLEQYRSDHPHAAIPGESQDLVVPTSEELGEEFERFLKQLDGTDNDSDL